MRKMLLTAVAALALTTGAAFAQTDSGSEPAGSNEGDAGGTAMELEQPDMTPFFMEGSTEELRPMEENRTTFMAMPEDQQLTYREQCELAKATDPSAETNGEKTASVDPGTLNLTVQAFCDQMTEFGQ